LAEPFSLTGGGYLNDPEFDQSAARVAAAFGTETFDRLRRIKAAEDPANRFRYNANMPRPDQAVPEGPRARANDESGRTARFGVLDGIIGSEV
jgi:hypothetical protein